MASLNRMVNVCATAFRLAPGRMRDMGRIWQALAGLFLAEENGAILPAGVKRLTRHDSNAQSRLVQWGKGPIPGLWN